MGARIDRPDRQRLQRDALVHRAHIHAEVAAHAFLIDHLEIALAVALFADRLVRGVFTRDVAATALDAERLIDVRLDGVVEIQMFPVDEFRYGLADEIGFDWSLNIPLTESNIADPLDLFL